MFIVDTGPVGDYSLQYCHAKQQGILKIAFFLPIDDNYKFLTSNDRANDWRFISFKLVGLNDQSHTRDAIFHTVVS